MAQDAVGSLVFESMQESLSPPRRHRVPGALQQLGNGTHVRGGMRKIQNAHRIRAMVVDKPDEPLGAIGHRGDRLCPFHSAPMHFEQRGLFKPGHITEPGTVRKVLQLRLLGSGGRARGWGDVPQDQGFDLGPDSSHQGHHRAICAHHLLGCGWRCRRHPLLELLGLLVPLPQRRFPGVQRVPPRTGLADPYPQQTLQQLGGGSKGHPGRQAHQAFLRMRSQITAQQPQLLIQGGKALAHSADRFHSYVLSGPAGPR